MSEDLYLDVKAFHRKFDIEHGDGHKREDLAEMRVVHLKEECDELCGALDAVLQKHPDERQPRDYAEVLDGVCDLVWVALGTADVLGLPFEQAWKAVYRANMSKMKAKSADDSARGFSCDIVKPPNFQPPDIVGILSRTPPQGVKK